MPASVITKGSAATLTAVLLSGVAPYAIGAGEAVTASLVALDDTVLVAPFAVSATQPGANWPAGIVAVPVSSTMTQALSTGRCVLRIVLANSGHPLTWDFDATVVWSLFTPKDIAKLQSNQMMMLAKGVLGSGFNADPDYLFGKLLAAEKEAQRRLRCFLMPTTVFAKPATDAEKAAVTSMPWAEESAYDYDPHLWTTEDWGYTVLRQKPVIGVDSIVFAYPAPMTGVFTVPIDWIRVDKKAGHIQFVPTGASLQVGPLSMFLLSAMGGGRTIPQMIQFKYRAGLEDAHTNWPDLIDLIYKMAALLVIKDAWLPQSGSISADGLSQSMSVDMDKFEAGIDSALDALVQAIHGPRLFVL